MSLIKALHQIIKHPLNEKKSLLALLRFLRWQIASRLAPGGIALPFVNTTYLLTKKGMRAATGNYYSGLMELTEMGFLLHMLKADDLFVDVGANIGSYTILAAGAVGAKTVSIEPIKATYEALRQNVLLNDVYDRVELLNIGMSDVVGILKFTFKGDSINHVLRDGEVAESISIPVSTIDAIMADRTPTLIKIDVEGFELKVLEGGMKTLARQGILAVIVETNDLNNYYGATNNAITDFMNAHGFKKYSYNPFSRKLQECNNQKSNSLFVRNPEEIIARVKSAPQFKLINGEI